MGSDRAKILTMRSTNSNKFRVHSNAGRHSRCVAHFFGAQDSTDFSLCIHLQNSVEHNQSNGKSKLENNQTRL
jgi:hypothetical protein